MTLKVTHCRKAWDEEIPKYRVGDGLIPEICQNELDLVCSFDINTSKHNYSSENLRVYEYNYKTRQYDLWLTGCKNIYVPETKSYTIVADEPISNLIISKL